MSLKSSLDNVVLSTNSTAGAYTLQGNLWLKRNQLVRSFNLGLNGNRKDSILVGRSSFCISPGISIDRVALETKTLN